MTSELANLLDGEVAARFGRAVCCDRPISMIRDVWTYSAGDCQYQIDNPTAEALWLAHLLAVCGEMGWCLTMWPHRAKRRMIDHVCIEDYNRVQWEYEAKERGLLHALSRAMLAVPVTPQPPQAQG